MKTPKCCEHGCRRYAEPNDVRCKQHGEAYERFWNQDRHNRYEENGRRATPKSSDDA